MGMEGRVWFRPRCRVWFKQGVVSGCAAVGHPPFPISLAIGRLNLSQHSDVEFFGNIGQRVVLRSFLIVSHE